MKLLEERRNWLIEQHNALLVNAEFRPRIKSLEAQIDKIMSQIPQKKNKVKIEGVDEIDRRFRAEMRKHPQFDLNA